MLWNAHERINHGTRNQNNGNGKDTGWLQSLFQPFNHLFSFFFPCHVSLCLRVAFEEENACLTSSSDKQQEDFALAESVVPVPQYETARLDAHVSETFPVFQALICER